MNGCREGFSCVPDQVRDRFPAFVSVLIWVFGYNARGSLSISANSAK